MEARRHVRVRHPRLGARARAQRVALDVRLLERLVLAVPRAHRHEHLRRLGDRRPRAQEAQQRRAVKVVRQVGLRRADALQREDRRPVADEW